VQCLRTVRKNDTLTYFGFGLRVGSPIFWGLFNSFRLPVLLAVCAKIARI